MLGDDHDVVGEFFTILAVTIEPRQELARVEAPAAPRRISDLPNHAECGRFLHNGLLVENDDVFGDRAKLNLAIHRCERPSARRNQFNSVCVDVGQDFAIEFGDSLTQLLQASGVPSLSGRLLGVVTFVFAFDVELQPEPTVKPPIEPLNKLQLGRQGHLFTSSDVKSVRSVYNIFTRWQAGEMIILGKRRTKVYYSDMKKNVVLYGFGTVFLLGCLLGGAAHFYDRFWWWDDMLHCMSGILLVAVAVRAMGAIHAKQSAVLQPLYVAVVAFCFALAIGVLWEILEFSSDLMFHTALQQWDMPPQAIVMGASYQGMGLRDTMSDLINATIGAAIAASWVYIRRRQSR